MGGRDQSQVKIEFKKFEKIKSVPKDVPKSHNDDKNPPTLVKCCPLGISLESSGRARRLFHHARSLVRCLGECRGVKGRS